MMDIYTEQVVPKKKMPGGKVILGLLVLLAIASAALVGQNFVFLFVAVIFGFLALRVWQNTDVEYEYIHTNHILDVDKVMNSSRRKSIISIDLKNVVVITRRNSDGVARYENLQKMDFTNGQAPDREYAMVCVVCGQQKLVLLQLNEKMLASLQKQIPGKFV